MDKNIIIDFDGTITYKDSISTIGMFINDNSSLKKDINYIRNKLLNSNLSSDNKTYLFHKFELNLISKYIQEFGINYELLSKFKIRDGFLELIDTGNIIISSSGIGNIIDLILDFNNIPKSNIKIVSNFYDKNYEFNNEIIYSRKKYLDSFDFSNQKNIIIGNHISDINMIPNDINRDLSICFINCYSEEYKVFDYIFDENSSFDSSISLIRKL